MTSGSSPDAAAPDDHRGVTTAELVLLAVTAVWGLSFVLVKGMGESINAAAGYEKSALGPLLVLAIRFTLAAACWSMLFPRSLRGWSRRNLGAASLIGTLLSVGLMLQAIGLDYTSEAVSAFLTSLTIIFVPLALWITFRTRPGLSSLIGVAIALPGVWLLNDVHGLRLGAGEWLGVACAVVFSWHLITINHFTPGDSPWRMTLGQFVVTAMTCWLAAGVLVVRGGVDPASILPTLIEFDFLWMMALLVVGPTVLCFGAMTHFQPRVAPARAVLIYLFEPVFAAAFAYLIAGRGMTASMLAGGALILIANVAVEFLGRRKST
jgi:drug/metabolite transporter (DMT)-like permease